MARGRVKDLGARRCVLELTLSELQRREFGASSGRVGMDRASLGARGRVRTAAYECVGRR